MQQHVTSKRTHQTQMISGNHGESYENIPSASTKSAATTHATGGPEAHSVMSATHGAIAETIETSTRKKHINMVLQPTATNQGAGRKFKLQNPPKRKQDDGDKGPLYMSDSIS
jgi:hypothetical protein